MTWDRDRHLVSEEIMTTISGIRCSGLGHASKNLIAQIPEIAKCFPEIAEAYKGTINLKLDRPMVVIKPDHVTDPIFWHKSFENGEVFEFLRIKFEAPEGADPVEAWLYIPKGSPHRKDKRKHEVIALQKLDLASNARCRIHILDDASVEFVDGPS